MSSGRHFFLKRLSNARRAPGSSDDATLWGEDQLGNAPLADGKTFTALKLAPGRYDVLVVDPDGREQLVRGLALKAGGEVLPSAPRGGPAGFPGGPGSPASTPVRGGSAAPRRPLGGSIHEVGTARMSVSPKEGVLNSFCQTHDIPNLYVFGGNAFPSTGDKHPTLTMMALTARGCDHLLGRR